MQCVCQTVLALSGVILAKIVLRNRGVEAQCLCQRPPSALSQAIRAKVERREWSPSASASARPPPSPKPLS